MLIASKLPSATSSGTASAGRPSSINEPCVRRPHRAPGFIPSCGWNDPWFSAHRQRVSLLGSGSGIDNFPFVAGAAAAAVNQNATTNLRQPAAVFDVLTRHSGSTRAGGLSDAEWLIALN